MMKLQADEQKAISRYVHSVCGVALDDSKAYLIEGRLGRLAEEAGCASFSQLLERARNEGGAGLERRIVDAITTNETLFFRDSSPFDLLRHKLIPEWIDRFRRTPGGSLRIWSAACSTGQEIYSIAMLLKELLVDPERYRVRLLGTDISDDAVSRASKAQYSAVEMARGLPGDLLAKHFVRRGDLWQVRDEVRAMVSFRRLNLLHDFSALGRFDIVFCRNVAIYFNDTDRKSLFERIARVLEPSGALVIGAMESLTGICPQFESKRHLRALYYQLRP